MSAGFPEPNYTQTPNRLFEMLGDMSDAELRVTLVMIRQTFGYHRNGFKMGVSKLAEAAGLSRQAALDGARKAEERGTFRRVNPDAQGEAEWELIVDDDSQPLQPVEAPLYPVEAPPLASRGQVGIKESIKENDRDIADAKFSEIARYLESKGIILKGMDADLIATWLEKHEPARIKQAIDIAAAKGARYTAYIDKILIGWEANGYPKSREEQIKERKGENKNGSNKSSKPEIQQASPSAGDLEAARLVIERKRARGEL